MLFLISTKHNTGWPKNLEFDNLGKKTWNLRKFENNLEFCLKVMEKPGISYKIMVKPGIFLIFKCFTNFDIINKKK